MARATKTNVMIRLRCTYDNGKNTFKPGEVIGVSGVEAAAMLKSGLAENALVPATAKEAGPRVAAKTNTEQPLAPQGQSGDSSDGGDGEAGENPNSGGGEEGDEKWQLP